MERFWEQSIFKYLRAEPEDHYVCLVSHPSCYQSSLDVSDAFADMIIDGATSEPSREQGKHSRDHVREFQRPGIVSRNSSCTEIMSLTGQVHCRPSCPRASCLVDIVKSQREDVDGCGH